MTRPEGVPEWVPQWIIDSQEELADRFEAYEPRAEDERDVQEWRRKYPNR